MTPCIDHGRAAKGYVRTARGGVRDYLHREVLAKKLGRPLRDGEVCRHECDNMRCINEDHLIQGTQTDNVVDRDSRGRTAKGSCHYAAKLDEVTVRAIRAEYIPRDRQHGARAIARRLGVTQTIVSDAIRGVSWKEVSCQV